MVREPWCDTNLGVTRTLFRRPAVGVDDVDSTQSDPSTHSLCFDTGMCINIVEVSWKAKLKQAFPDPNSYSSFMGNFSSMTGTVTLIMMLLGRTIFQKFGWRTAALVTPAVSTAVAQRSIQPREGIRGLVEWTTSTHRRVLLNVHNTDDWRHRARILCDQHLP